MSSKNNDEEPVMHSKSDNIEITSHDKVDEFKEELFQSLLSSWKYQWKVVILSLIVLIYCITLS